VVKTITNIINFIAMCMFNYIYRLENIFKNNNNNKTFIFIVVYTVSKGLHHFNSLMERYQLGFEMTPLRGVRFA
jgi:DMSO reductase anchor subunit